jgi:hypothetical protein
MSSGEEGLLTLTIGMRVRVPRARTPRLCLTYGYS